MISGVFGAIFKGQNKEINFAFIKKPYICNPNQGLRSSTE
jgi:hypothetical protein